jgi:RNA polymerase sigma factor (sigma-70 family)
MQWLREIDRWFIDEVLPHAPSYRAKAVRLIGPDEADDLVQEAYARIMTRTGFLAIANPKNFVLTIIQNLAVDRFRKAKLVSITDVAVLEVQQISDPAPDAFRQAADRAELERLFLLLEKLPPQCRRVVTMRRLQGLPPAEIAEALSLSVSTVEKHLARGLALLTKGLENETEVPGSSNTEGRYDAWAESKEKTGS